MSLAILDSIRLPGRTRPGVTSWSNPKILLIFSLLFVSGFACGSAVTSMLLHARMAAETKKVDLADLKRQLHLSPQQEATVDRELDDYAKYYQNIEEEREDVAEHGVYRILAVLTPEQKRQFLRLFRTEPLLKNFQKH